MYGKKCTNSIIDLEFENDEDEELAKMEEMEAMSIQQRLLGELEGVDLSLDLMVRDIVSVLWYSWTVHEE